MIINLIEIIHELDEKYSNWEMRKQLLKKMRELIDKIPQESMDRVWIDVLSCQNSFAKDKLIREICSKKTREYFQKKIFRIL